MYMQNNAQTYRMFLRFISHQLRTPLNTMYMGLQYLDEDMSRSLETPSRLETIRDIRSSGHAALSILNDMLTYDSIEGGLLTLDKESVSLLNCIQDVLQPLRYSHNFEISYMQILYSKLLFSLNNYFSNLTLNYLWKYRMWTIADLCLLISLSLVR